MKLSYQISGLAWLALGVGCAHAMIAGSQVPDTQINRDIMEVIEGVRKAAINRDADALIRYISTSYFENMGTADPKDDYGYKTLEEKILPLSLDTAKELYLNIEVQDVTVEGDTASVDIRYSSRARLELPIGEHWDSHREFSRMRLVREGQVWRVTQGL
jgi:hypothetical protein